MAFKNNINAGDDPTTRAGGIATGAGAIGDMTGANANLGATRNTDMLLSTYGERAGSNAGLRHSLDNVQGEYTDRRKQQVNPYQNYNLAKQNPMGNLNNKTAVQTDRLSRAADALNNRMWWQSGGFHADTLRGGVGTGSGVAEMHRFDPITTQEMRQQRMNENVEQAVRAQQAQLQADTNRHSLELQQARDNMSMGQLSAYYMNDPQIEALQRQTNINLNWAMPAQLAYAQNASNIAAYAQNFLNYDFCSQFYDLWREDPSAAAMLMDKIGYNAIPQGVALQFNNRMEWQKAQEERLGRPLTSEEQLKVYNDADRQLATEQHKADIAAEQATSGTSISQTRRQSTKAKKDLNKDQWWTEANRDIYEKANANPLFDSVIYDERSTNPQTGLKQEKKDIKKAERKEAKNAKAERKHLAALKKLENGGV